MNNGWIKIHRSMLDWEWWDDQNTRMLWLTILLSVNHEPKRWHGITVDAGEMITSYAALAQKSGLSYQSVRTSLEHLISTHEVTCESTHQFTRIKVVKWAEFQSLDAPPNIPTNTRSNRPLTEHQQSTNNKQECKNDKNVRNKNNTIPPTLAEVTEYCKSRHNNVDPQTFMDFYESKGWMVGKNKMKDWKACVRTWEKSDRKTGHVVIEPPDYFRTAEQKEYDPEAFKW